MINFRRIEKNDCDFINGVRNSCAEYLHDNRKFSKDDTLEWILKNDPDYYIVLFNDIKIGYIRLSNHSTTNRNIYIGMDLHEDYRGKELSYNAYKLFIPHLFDKQGLNKISLEVLKTNVRAYNLYKKLGFVEEGTKREEIFRNGEYIDSFVMSILKKEWIKN